MADTRIGVSVALPLVSREDNDEDYKPVELRPQVSGVASTGSDTGHAFTAVTASEGERPYDQRSKDFDSKHREILYGDGGT